MISLTSTITAMSDLEWILVAPSPSTKASTRAVITPITGGIATVKKGASSCAFAAPCIGASLLIKWGKTALPVR